MALSSDCGVKVGALVAQTGPGDETPLTASPRVSLSVTTEEATYPLSWEAAVSCPHRRLEQTEFGLQRLESQEASFLWTVMPSTSSGSDQYSVKGQDTVLRGPDGFSCSDG